MLKFWKIDSLALSIYLILTYFTITPENLPHIEEGLLSFMKWGILIMTAPILIIAAETRSDSTGSDNKYIFSLSLLGSFLTFVIFLGGINIIGPILLHTTNKVNQAIEQEKQFRQEVNFSANNVIMNYSPGIMGGFVSLKNSTAYDWESVYIILNPNVETNGDSIAFTLGAEAGFRAPGDNSKVYSRIPAGESLTIPLNDFLQTSTGEIFSSDRYHLRKAYVKAVIQHNGQPHDFDCLLQFNL